MIDEQQILKKIDPTNFKQILLFMFAQLKFFAPFSSSIYICASIISTLNPLQHSPVQLGFDGRGSLVKIKKIVACIQSNLLLRSYTILTTIHYNLLLLPEYAIDSCCSNYSNIHLLWNPESPCMYCIEDKMMKKQKYELGVFKAKKPRVIY